MIGLGFVKNLKPLIYLKQVFSGGTDASFGRFGTGSVMFMTFFWVTYLVIKNGTMPDMAGPSTFLASGATTLYGINKLAEVKKAKDAGDADEKKEG